MPGPSRAWLALARLVIRLCGRAHRRTEIEGDLIELWQQRRAAGRRGLRAAYIRDLAGLIRANTLGPQPSRRSSSRFEISQDIRYAWRVVWRSPGTTIAAIATLAIGIGSSLAIFTALDRLLLNPLPYPEPHRLVHVENAPVRLGPVKGSLISRSFRELAVIESAGGWTPGGLNLDGAGQSRRLTAAVVDDGFFRTMGVPALIGQPLPLPDGSRMAVISHELWQGVFARDPSITGRAISLNGKTYVVTGVMPRGFTFPGRTDVWVPPNADDQMTGSAFWVEAIARLKPGVSLEQARAVVAAYDVKLRAQYGGPPDDAVTLSPLGGELTRRVKPTLLLLGASAALLLLAVCASVANLLLARVAMRDQELTVRRALGATRWRLTRLLLIESLLLSVSGAAAGVLLAVWGLQALGSLAPDALDSARVMQIDLRFAIAAIAATLVTALAFGVAPGLAAAARQSGDIVRAGRQEVRSPFWSRVRSTLIGAQMAVALVLLTTSAAAVAALLELTRIDPGFGATRAVGMTVTLPAARFPRDTIAGFVSRARERLAAVPGVKRVGATSILPDSRELGMAVALSHPGAPAGTKPLFAPFLVATPDYFEAMGVRLIAGRTFSPADRPGAPRVIIISERTARELFPGKPAIGQRIDVDVRNKQTHEVIGVVADVHLRGLAAGGVRQVYVPFDVLPPWAGISFVIEVAGAPADAIPALRAAMREIDPALPPYSVQPIDTIVDRFTASHRMAGSLISSFAIVTLIVAAIGLYGLMAQLVTERTREIAIRVALGAAPSSVRRRLVRFGALHAAGGALAGVLSASAAVAVFGAVVPGLAPPGVLVFAINVAVLFVTAIAAVWIPASRILRLDPISSLRQ